MNKRPNNNSHRKIWESYNNKKLDRGLHVHHIDGNPLNNDPKNLLACTAKEHYDIHLNQGDYAACILLSKAADISKEELSNIQHLHGVKCRDKKLGIHSEKFDRDNHLIKIWKYFKPGRKPVTNGKDVLRLKTDVDVVNFLADNPDWKRGLPASHKKGLSLSKHRFDSDQSKKLSELRLTQGTHNFIQQYVCPHCKKTGKGPMMKRWHFDNCKQHDKKYT
jgi:hypothetical protein